MRVSAAALSLCLLAVAAAAQPASAAVESVAPVRADELSGGQLFMDAAGVTHLAMVLHAPATTSGSAIRQRRCIVYANDRGGAFSYDTVGCYTEEGAGSLRAAPAPAIAVRFGRPFIAWVRTGAGGVAISKRDRDGGRWQTDTVRRISRAEYDTGLQVNVEGNRARVSWSRCRPADPPVCRIAYAVRSDGASFRVLTVDVNAGEGTQLALGRLPYVLYRLAGRSGQPRELRLSRITRTGGRPATVAGNAVHGFDLVSVPEGVVVAYQQGRAANRRIRLVAGPAHGAFAQVAPRVRSFGGPLQLARSAVPGAPVRFVVAHLAARAACSCPASPRCRPSPTAAGPHARCSSRAWGTSSRSASARATRPTGCPSAAPAARPRRVGAPARSAWAAGTPVSSTAFSATTSVELSPMRLARPHSVDG